MKFTLLKRVFISLLGVVAFCMVAHYFGILPANILPISFMGACLGAIISALITLGLLNSQTEHDEIKTRNVKVFEKKSKFFHKFIDDLWCILEKQKITMDDYNKLRKDFSIRLMIYLKEKSNKTIAKNIKNIGESVNNSNSTYENLKENIFSIINILCAEINLGGRLYLDIDNELEGPIFPMLFKQSILNELNEHLMPLKELCEGKFISENQLTNDGKWGGEYACFNFLGYKGCKLLVGSFSKYCPHAGIWILLFIEKDIHSVDEFRYNDENEFRFCDFSKYLVPIHKKEWEEEGDWINLTSSYADIEEYPELGGLDIPSDDWWLFLDDPECIEPFRNNYQESARIIGKRAAYWFKNGLIYKKENAKPLSITEFLEKYLGNKE